MLARPVAASGAHARVAEAPGPARPRTEERLGQRLGEVVLGHPARRPHRRRPAPGLAEQPLAERRVAGEGAAAREAGQGRNYRWTIGVGERRDVRRGQEPLVGELVVVAVTEVDDDARPLADPAAERV